MTRQEPPPFDPDPELIDHLEGNMRERGRYRAAAEAMREGRMPYTQNPDRVTPPVAVGAVTGLIIAALLKTYLDVEVDPADATQWWEWFTAVVVPLLPAVGGFVGARFKARNDVTPVKPGDTPRDQDGNLLRPASHTESTGYLPTRAATDEERPRRRKPPGETSFP